MGDSLSHLLAPIASQLRSLGIPEPIVQWGHPLMMAMVIFMMASFVGLAGWRGRLAQDKAVAEKSREDHRKLAPWMLLFLALGYTGGVLSLVMQQQPIMESLHFWTGSAVLLLLAINGLIALTGFRKGGLRTTHAYLGSGILGLLILHVAFGLKLGWSI